MEERRWLRRRADSATVAGDQLRLYRPTGEIARIAVVVDQLDDAGLRTPLVEDVLAAFPYGELHAATDRRAAPGAVAHRTPVVWNPRARRCGLWRRRTAPATPDLGDYDVVLRLGDRRARGFLAHPDALDLTFILGLDDGDDATREPTLGAALRDRCAVQSADRVWCATQRLVATLKRRWNVEAQLLYPPVELAELGPSARRGHLVLAAADAITPSWNARLDALARWRVDLEIVKHGGPAVRRRRGGRSGPASPARFAELLPHALAVVLPRGDGFEPRAVWAAAAGVPVITPVNGAAAETVAGLTQRHPTGVLLDEPTDTALADAIAFVERHAALFTPERLSAHAKRWSRPRFRQTLKRLVLEAWCEHVTASADAEPATSTPDAKAQAAAPAP
ncbi:MAG: hypothetical protein ACLFTL_10445 [Alphaproteobacteria bacterium]